MTPLSRMRAADGLTLIEVMVAVLLLSGGLLATLSIFDSGQRVSASSGRAQEAHAIAQAQLEELSHVRTASEWTALALSSWPSWETYDGAANPGTPAAYLRGGSGTHGDFTACAPCTKLAIPQDPTDKTSSAPSGVTSPENLVVDTSAGTIAPKVMLSSGAGTVYRYVTVASDRTVTLGSTTHSPGRRITVAVVLSSSATNTLTKPVWASTIVTDPAVVPQ